MKTHTHDPRPRLVILGSGFGALQLIRKLKRNDYRVTVISPRNHFLFTPLLIGSAVGTVEPRNITEPVRGAGRLNAHYLHAACRGVDLEKRSLRCESPLDGAVFNVDYDRLVIAIGADSNTFGIPGVREHSHFLKEAEDARRIRQNILGCLERASLPGTATEERARLLHWVVVGGGATGSEFAAELHDFLQDVRDKYPGTADRASITLLEAGDQILPAFDQALRTYAEKRFRREHVKLRKSSPATEVGPGKIQLKSGGEISCGLIVWATGIIPRPLIRECGLPTTEQGFLKIDACCRVEGQEDIYGVGDTAQRTENTLPATAQVAQQQGQYLARALTRGARGKSVKPFRFHQKGMLTYLGGRRAMADLPAGSLKGRTAWIFWRSVYLTKLVGMRNKIRVLWDWILTRIFGRETSRIT